MPRGEYMQWFIIAAPGHPYLHAVIQRVLDNIARYTTFRFGVGHGGVLRATGPIAYSLAIQPIVHLHPHRLVEAQTDMGLMYEIPGDRASETLQEVRRTAHYSRLTCPVVAPGSPRDHAAAWVTAQVERFRPAASRLKRRIGRR